MNTPRLTTDDHSVSVPITGAPYQFLSINTLVAHMCFGSDDVCLIRSLETIPTIRIIISFITQQKYYCNPFLLIVHPRYRLGHFDIKSRCIYQRAIVNTSPRSTTSLLRADASIQSKSFPTRRKATSYVSSSAIGYLQRSTAQRLISSRQSYIRYAEQSYYNECGNPTIVP